jgi:uncharacterized protein (TIGR03086 family)
MTPIADRYRRRADAFEALVASTPPERWSSPSPCAGWVARDVVEHVVGHSAQVLRERAGVPAVAAPPAADDPAGAFRATRRAVQRVLDDPGTTPEVAAYLDAALGLDLPQHGWDLAKATGRDATMDPDDVEALWTTLTEVEQGWWRWHRENGWYAPAVAVPDGAPLQDRLLGLIGRDPGWTPPGAGGGRAAPPRSATG